MRESLTPRNMFAAACYTFVKTTGKGTLHEVSSLDDKDKVKILQVVKKSRRRRWIFFEKSIFTPEEFQVQLSSFQSLFYNRKVRPQKLLSSYRHDD